MRVAAPMIPRIFVTYNAINLVLLLKTLGGSSFIWLLSKDLREDIPRLQFKLYSYSQVVKRQQLEEFARRLIFPISQAAVAVSEKSSLHINYFKCHIGTYPTSSLPV